MPIRRSPLLTPQRAPRHGRGQARRAMLPFVMATILGISSAVGAAGFGVLAADGSPKSDSDAVAEQPGIHYEQALEHAADANVFTPGDAVTVPFRPRARDSYAVGGSAPVPLPAGRASGRSMAASRQGSIRAVPDVAVPAEPMVQGEAFANGTVNLLRREVFGFLPYWESSYTPYYDTLSTIAYFGVNLDGTGNLVKRDPDDSTSTGWAGWTSSWMTRVLNDAHANGTRVVITVESFAWGSSGIAVQTALLSSKANRDQAIAQIVGAVTDRGADGVNLDFEPIASGQSANFVTFVRDLRTAFDAVHPGYEITFCATGRMTTYAVSDLLAVGAADAVFVMGYDFRSIHEATAGSIDPLTSPKIFDLTDSMNRFMANAPVSKIILGLPYYGRPYKTVSNAPYAATRAGSTASNATYAYAAGMASVHGRNYDSIEQSAWTAYQDSNGYWTELYYDDVQSISARDDMINYWNLRGMGIWVLGYDTGAGHDDLTKLVAAKFLTDMNPPKAGIVNLAPIQRDEGFAVSWTARDDWNGVKNYDVQVSIDGGAFGEWLTGTTDASSKYQGTTGHNYAFRVRATDGVGNVGPWDVATTYTAAPAFTVGGFATVVAPTVGELSSPTTSASTVKTAAAGTILQIIDGPVLADGYTWYQVTGPFTELNAVAPLFPGLWVAASDVNATYVVPSTAPNSTAVVAGIDELVVGTPGVAPSSTGIDRGKVFSPDGDGIHDTLPLSWVNSLAFDSVVITVYKPSGELAGEIALGSQGTGAQSFAWSGKVDGASAPVADGQYLLQISGTAGATTYYSPSAAPFVAAQWTSFGVVIDTTPTGTYHALAPVRILDTRNGTGMSGTLVTGTARSFAVAGKNGVPANALAITGNLTVTGATAAGFGQLGPTTTGASSTINFKKGDNRANGVTLGLAPDGSLSVLYVSTTPKATTHVVFDLTGYFVADVNGATFVPLAPIRLVDSRLKQGISAPLAANQVATFQVAGLSGVPSNAIAVTGNATVTGQTGSGYILVAPSITPGIAPTTSTLNFPLGDNRANNVVVPLGSGQLQVEYVGKARTTTQFVFDVTGYFVPDLSGATFVPLTPGRVVDSRIASGFQGPLMTGASATFPVSGQVSIHLVAIAVVGNLTVTGQTSRGWLAVGPAMTTSSSTLNFPVGDVRANGFVCVFGTGGTLAVTFGGGTGGSSAQVVVDVLGYYR